jgi:hypothetical protein
MPYAYRAFSNECVRPFSALLREGQEFRAPALAIRRIAAHPDAVNERTLFA